MTVVPSERRRRPPPRRRGRLLLVSLLIALGFVLGIALGEALHDNPKPGGEQTLVRTLTPLPLEPAAATTTSGP